MKRGSQYARDEDAFILRARQQNYSFSQIAGLLDRSAEGVKKRYAVLINKGPPQSRPFTVDEDWLLVRYRSQGMPWHEIGHVMGRRAEVVANRYYKLEATQPKSPDRQHTLSMRDIFEMQTKRHEDAVMEQGGFCAFTDNGNKRTGLGVCLPMIWPRRRA